MVQAFGLPIKENGQSQNGGYKKKMHVKFPDKLTFLTLWYVRVRISGWEMFVLQKVWRDLFSYNHRFEICPFALLAANYSMLHKPLLKFIRPAERKTYHINDSVGIKLLTIWRLSFSHLCEHKFRYNFEDTFNSLCSCSIEIKTITDYFLRFHFYNENQEIIIKNFQKSDESLPILRDTNFVDLLYVILVSMVLKNIKGFLKFAGQLFCSTPLTITHSCFPSFIWYFSQAWLLSF